MDPTSKIDWQSAVDCLHALAEKGLVRQGMTTDGTTRWHLTGLGESFGNEDKAAELPVYECESCGDASVDCTCARPSFRIKGGDA